MLKYFFNIWLDRGGVGQHKIKAEDATDTSLAVASLLVIILRSYMRGFLVSATLRRE